MKYDNLKKTEARGWAWNQICQRIPHKAHRRWARVYVLIGDTTLELETAEKKHFSRYNVIGVDIRKKPVEQWRAAGGLAIQAPIEAVVALSKVRPQAVIADFCSGLTNTSYDSFLMMLCQTAIPGCVVINLMRGRDDIEKFRGKTLVELANIVSTPKVAEMLKKRSMVLLMNLFQHLCLNNPENLEVVQELNKHIEQAFDIHGVKSPKIKDLKTIAEAGTLRKMRHFDDTFFELFGPFMRKLQPAYHEYRSDDSNQWFDSLAINAFCKEGVNDTDLSQLRESFKDRCDLKKVQLRMAALEAVRTTRINQLPWKKRLMYEPE